jgi:4-hydroxybenzoate polyprenyltransferase/phosphoserine phosphatase
MSARVMNERRMSADTVPLCVDLDGTLVNTDTLIEAAFLLIKARPSTLLQLPGWLLRGKAYFKQRIAELAELDVASLPFNEALIEFLRAEKRSGRHLVLATGANERIAGHVSSHLGFFDEVLASTVDENLTGVRKRDKLVERFGERGFDYASNDRVDLKIWPHARGAVVVNATAAVERLAQRESNVVKTIPRRGQGLVDYLKCIRIHQWAKNALVFIPLLTSHQFGNLGLVFDALVAFISYSLCSSSVYVLNDALDLPSDRAHPTKRHRPLAAGRVSIKHAVLMIPLLTVASFALALCVNPGFVAVLAFYYVMTVGYSFVFKARAVVDVLVLAGLYVLRVIGGAEAIGVHVSFWLLAFSMFIFLSLALVKRSSELIAMKEDRRTKPAGRGYRVTDLEYLHSMGTSSGYLAVLVLALYIHSADMLVLYAQPQVLWLLCPLLLYWISYVWLKTGRGEMHDDPVLFALKDRQSRVIGALGFVIVLGAMV